MTSRFYRLPSLNALATFETSARHLSFRRAADELNVTPGAVSRQIKALEDELGVALFARNPSGLTLSAEGAMLHAALGTAFAKTAETVEAIRAGPRQPQVTLACTHAFAKCWLLPRMDDFWRHHPEICLNHLISDDGREFRRPEVDLRIRYGTGDWPGEAAARLFGDTIYPVAAPGLAARHPDCRASDLASLPLLHVDWVDSDWLGWDELLRLRGTGQARLPGQRFNNFEIAIRACRDGRGVAVGWDRLVGDLVAAGELVRFTELVVPAPGSYHLTWNAGADMGNAVGLVRNWLLDMAGRDESTPRASPAAL